MDASQLIRHIHAAPTRLVLALNGGSQAIADLLAEPGGSRTLLEALVPYSTASLANWLGATPEHFCSAKTARAMAMAAYRRAEKLTEAEPPEKRGRLAGVACSASLVSDRPKRGPHRIHVAAQTATFTSTHSVELIKGKRNRQGEEDIASRMTLNAIAEACELSDRLPTGLELGEVLLAHRTDAPREWQDLLAGRLMIVRQSGDSLPKSGDNRPDSSRRRLLFSGAFNRMHDGHREMARVASEMTGLPVDFELSIVNVDKPPLDFIEMEERAAQFDANATLWFTRAATFQRKVELFPNATFVTGADTIVRIADPRYYDYDPQAMAESIDRLAASGARFMVFGRIVAGEFQTLNQIPLPANLLAICDEVPADRFRADVSSTELRRSGG